MKLEDDAHKLLTCINFKFKIGIGSALADS